MDFHLLDLKNVPIWEQLQIEEALLRSDTRNWCVINSGSPQAIVMGISGKPELLLNKELIQKFQIPVWKRFSGGGTVVIDENTLFITFICNIDEVKVYGRPDKIHEWAEKLYRGIFPQKHFRLRENDYVFGDMKFGGNAQYLRRGRWLHHTSFLWDFDFEKMKCLLLPPKAPEYRKSRSHSDFLCGLSNFMSNREDVFEELKKVLATRYQMNTCDMSSVVGLLDGDHRKATQIVPV